MVKVLHFSCIGPSFDRRFGDDFGAAAAHYLAHPESWFLVATVDTEDMDYAFERTNNIDYCWTQNFDVKPVLPYGPYRSTMVGDIMVDTTSKRCYFVAPVGFKEF